MFNVVFHHGGEFVRLNDGDMIYSGGVLTIVYGNSLISGQLLTFISW